MNSRIDIFDMIHSLYACEDPAEFHDLWNVFETMYEHKFISDETWQIFCYTCDDLIFDPDPDVYRVVHLSYT